MSTLPPGWESKDVSEVVLLQRGFDLPVSERRTGSVAVLGSNGQVGTHDEFPVGVPVPTLTVGRSGSVGKVCFSEEGAWPLNTTLFAGDYCGNDPRYIYFWLQHFDLARYAQGVSVPTLNRNSFSSIKVHVPPLGEQRSIGGVLDLCWQAVSTERALQEKASELKRAAMARVFTRGLRGEPQKETEIGPMPASWNPRTILELCEIWSGGTPRKSIPEYWNGDIPWVSGKDLKAPELNDAIDHVSAAGVEAGSRLAPAGAVLLLVRGMGLAKDLPVAVINKTMAFNQDVKALVSRGQYSGWFLRSAIYAGKERLLSQIVPSAHGTMTLNLNDVETFKVACPTDPDEAKEVVTILGTLDRKIELHQRKLAVLDELFMSLLHKLMTAEIAVSDLDLSVLTRTSTRRAEVAA